MFKTIPEFPRWEIDESGNIRNVESKQPKYVNVSKSGYYHVLFKKDGKTYARKVHRLVAEAFIPVPEDVIEACKDKYPYKPCVNHIDHNKLNNHVSNLEWCDIAWNNKAAMEMGVVPPLKGSLNGRALLTEDLVHLLCKDFQDGMTPSEAIIKYEGVSRQQASKIRAGIAWKHISCQYDIKPLKKRRIQ